MNKLIMSQKEECNNYNLIIENINKLVDMCGNTKEAIELRDNLFNLFTTKYSEPLYDTLELQEQLGCPLDVLFNAINDGIYYTYSKWAFGRDKFQKLQVCLIYDYGKYRLQPTHKSNFLIDINEYKQTWWLKKDKSE